MNMMLLIGCDNNKNLGIFQQQQQKDCYFKLDSI